MSKNKSDNMENPVSQIELAAWTVVSERIDADAVERVKANAKRLASETLADVAPDPLADQDDKKVELKSVQQKGNSSRFGSWLVRGGLAAAIVGALVVASLLPGDNSAAFAAALKKLNLVKVFSFDMLVHSEILPEPVTSSITFCEDGRRRSETQGVVTVTDSSGIPRITLMTDSKTAIVHDIEAIKKAAAIADPVAGKDGPAFDQLAWLSGLKGFEGQKTIDLGEKKIAGVAVFGKEIHVDKHRLQAWVNAKSEELVMVEFIPPEDSPIEKMIVHNFNFDQEDAVEELFSFEVPEGYTTHSIPKELVNLIQSPEQHAIELMQAHAELSDGRLPISLSNTQDWFSVLIIEPADGGKPKLNTELAGKIGGFSPFLFSMKKENYGYLGDGVLLNQEEKVIVFWYKNKEGKIRAIYSDMTLGDIEKSDIPAPKEPPQPRQPPNPSEIGMFPEVGE